MNNNIVSMRDKSGKESRVVDGLSFYDAYSLVVDMRSEKDGNYYWIGKTREERMN